MKPLFTYSLFSTSVVSACITVPMVVVANDQLPETGINTTAMETVVVQPLVTNRMSQKRQQQ